MAWGLAQDWAEAVKAHWNAISEVDWEADLDTRLYAAMSSQLRSEVPDDVDAVVLKPRNHPAAVAAVIDDGLLAFGCGRITNREDPINASGLQYVRS